MNERVTVLPAPRGMEIHGDACIDLAPLRIHAPDPDCADAVDVLVDALAAVGVDAKTVPDADAANAWFALVPLPWVESLPADLREEAYELRVDKSGLHLHVSTRRGLCMGVQTVRQLLGTGTPIPPLTIRDHPRFPWRGLLLDVSRHFFDAQTVKRFIDLAVLHRLNTFHWHLTDDQGWRLPVDGYPKLTEIAAWRTETVVGWGWPVEEFDGTPHGGYYTHDEIRDVVAYAAHRGVRIIPEIDLPGHVQALLAAYPEFGNLAQHPAVRRTFGVSTHVLNLEPGTFAFVEAVLDTVCRLFPLEIIHLGGDEAPTEEWTADPRIRERMRGLGIDAPEGVQNHWTRRLAEMLRERGRTMACWDEVAERETTLPEGLTLMHWRDKEGDVATLHALAAGHSVVQTPCRWTYFDHCQAGKPDHDTEPLAIGGDALTLERVHRWDPLEGIPQAYAHLILGGQGQLWSEYIPTPAHLEYMTYPRAIALAEVLWGGAARAPWPTFRARLLRHEGFLKQLHVNVRPLEKDAKS